MNVEETNMLMKAIDNLKWKMEDYEKRIQYSKCKVQVELSESILDGASIARLGSGIDAMSRSLRDLNEVYQSLRWVEELVKENTEK